MENARSYDEMAGEFSRTRAKFWEELAFLAEHANEGARALDVGCGNGRFYPLLRDRHATYTGIDNSSELIAIAKKIYPEANFRVGEATALPFDDRSFDIAFSFAVIHHVPSDAARRRFVAEIARVLPQGATFIVTAWDLLRPRYLPALLSSALMSLFLLSPLDIGDIMHVFGKERTPRYLHAFTKRGLRRLLASSGFVVVGEETIERSSGSRERNLVFVCRRR